MDILSFSSNDIAIIIAAIGLAISNIIIAMRTNSKISEVGAKADVIAGHVNSAASAQAARIDGLRAEISTLKKALEDKTRTAAVLAQATSDRNSQEKDK